MIANILGKTAFSSLKRYREIAVSNLDEALGSDPDRNSRIAQDVFSNLAKNGADWVKLTSLKKKDINGLVTETHGLENLDKALANGKGAILLASHFGNWELLSIYLWANGYKGAVIARRLYFHKYDEFVEKLRKRFGAYIVYRDESPKKLLKVLKQGDILGILADQDMDDVDGTFVNFFGRPAYTPTAPVKLAAVTGASIVPAFMIRKQDNTYKLIVEEAISVSKGENKEADVERYTQSWTQVLEKYVKLYPEQWVWIHRRWKTTADHRL